MNILRPVLGHCFVQPESKSLAFAILFKKSKLKGTTVNMGENRPLFIRLFV